MCLKIIMFLCLLFNLTACEDNPLTVTRYSIKIVNNTSTRLNCSYGDAYPDTSLPLNYPYIIHILPNDFHNFNSSKKWESVVAEAPSDTLSFFIFNSDTLNAFPWAQIRNEYKILKRYDLSIQDLQSTNYTITYP